MENRNALLAGATGLVGGHLLDLLLADDCYAAVSALVRRPLALEHGKLDTRVVDFDRLGEVSDPPAVTDVFCCLGSTMKKAGSKAAFRQVDHDYVVAVARLGLAAGGRRFLLISSVGADAASMSFYLRVKGEAEAAVAELRYEAFHIFQPSILIGERDEARLGERVGGAAARVLNSLMVGPLRRYRGIRAETVAAAMAGAAKSHVAGKRVYTRDAIERLAAGTVAG